MISNSFLMADTVARTQFEFGRDFSTPLDWILPAAVLLLLAWFVIGVYILDCVELGGRFATVLITLRILALVGLLAVYLQPQWRSTRDVVDHSRVLVLVDNSQSMGRRDVQVEHAQSLFTKMLPYLEDSDSKTGGPPSSDELPEQGQTIRRIDRVVAEMQRGDLLAELRKVHDVDIYRFDTDDKPTRLASFPMIPAKAGVGASALTDALSHRAEVSTAQWRLGCAAGAFLLAVLLIGSYLLKPGRINTLSTVLLTASGAAVAVAIGLTIWGFVSAPNVTIRELLALDDAGASTTKEPVASEDGSPAIDWSQALTAQGADTQLGQAVYQLVLDHRTAPIAGVILLSDGQRTAGLEIDAAAKFAEEAEIPVYTIGFGTLEEPKYVRLADFAAPARAYQDDPFEVTAYLQSQGFSGRTASVTLRQMNVSEQTQQDAENTGMIYQVDAVLGADSNDVVPVVFDVEGIDIAGRYAFELEVAVKGAARHDTDARRRFYIDVVAHRTRVLLLAGGPSREYQFLRNLLRRDEKQIELDVMLQSRGESDDPDYLEGFPSNDELLNYDVLIAIDPTWQKLGAASAAMIEAWVGDDAGGLIVIPGSVHAGSIIQSWIHDPDYQKLRDLYPVTFHDEHERLGERDQTTQDVHPLEFTRDGMDAGFLQLDDNPIESQRIWTKFSGIYGGYVVKDKKYGATVYAYFSDDLAESLGYQPIFFAGQFYGKGRVFYLGSGEIWRIRKLDDSYFEQFYTRLIRHVSIGRLHRGSPRGDVLLLEKEVYHVGDTVPIVAQLRNAQREPYQAASVEMFVVDANDKGISIKLTADPARAGTYRGEFVAKQAQDYRLELQPPESDDQLLSKVIKVTTSDREKRRPQQDDQALKRLAGTTGGRYFASVEAALGQAGDAPLAPALEDHTRVTPVAGDIDPIWDAAWSRWMMFVLCGVLCFEWLLRRLFRLA